MQLEMFGRLPPFAYQLVEAVDCSCADEAYMTGGDRVQNYDKTWGCSCPCGCAFASCLSRCADWLFGFVHCWLVDWLTVK